MKISQYRITQHKSFVPSIAHPKFCFAETYSILEPLDEILNLVNNGR